MRYKVTLPQGTFDAAVTAEGVEDPGSGRRQWNIAAGGTNAALPGYPTEEGMAVMTTGRVGHDIVRQWTEKLRAGRWDDAFLLTLPGDQREQHGAALLSCSPALMGVAGLSPVGDAPAGIEALLDSRKAFAEGSVVKKDKNFWSIDEKLGREMIDEVRKLFSGTLAVPVEFELPVVRVPLIYGTGKNAQLGVSCRLIIMEPSGKPRFTVEGEILLEIPLSQTQPPLAATRISELRLLRGHTVAPPKPIDNPGAR